MVTRVGVPHRPADQSEKEKERRAEGDEEERWQYQGRDHSEQYDWKPCNATAQPDYIPSLDNLKAINEVRAGHRMTGITSIGSGTDPKSTRLVSCLPLFDHELLCPMLFSTCSLWPIYIPPPFLGNGKQSNCGYIYKSAFLFEIIKKQLDQYACLMTRWRVGVRPLDLYSGGMELNSYVSSDLPIRSDPDREPYYVVLYAGASSYS